MNEADILVEETGLLAVFIHTVAVILKLVHVYIQKKKTLLSLGSRCMLVD